MSTVLSRRPVGEGLRKDLVTFVESERRRADVAGAAVAVFDRDGVLEAGAFGYADFARGEPVTVDTLFRAASISKTLTTMLVLREIEVNQYLDPASQIRDADGAPSDVTIRHLLTHTSGLPVSWKGLEYGNIALKTLVLGTQRPRSLAEVVAGMHTVREPGGPIVYSNGGFALLGYVVARLHGRPFEELVQQSVLGPLKMGRSSFQVAPQGEGIATSYGSAMGLGRSAGRKPAPMVFNYSGPAGALVTTALELSRFGRTLLRGGELDGSRIVSTELLAEAMRAQAKNHPGLDIGWGLGSRRRRDPDLGDARRGCRRRRADERRRRHVRSSRHRARAGVDAGARAGDRAGVTSGHANGASACMARADEVCGRPVPDDRHGAAGAGSAADGHHGKATHLTRWAGGVGDGRCIAGAGVAVSGW